MAVRHGERLESSPLSYSSMGRTSASLERPPRHSSRLESSPGSHSSMGPVSSSRERNGSFSSGSDSEPEMPFGFSERIKKNLSRKNRTLRRREFDMAKEAQRTLRGLAESELPLTPQRRSQSSETRHGESFVRRLSKFDPFQSFFKKIGKPLGKGSFGQVHLCQWVRPRCPNADLALVAVKIFFTLVFVFVI